MSAQLQKVLSMGDRDLPPSKKILEVNPSAPLIARLSGIADCAEQAAFIKQCGRQLFANALLLEGVPLDPAELVSRVQGFMLDAAAAKSDT